MIRLFELTTVRRGNKIYLWRIHFQGEWTERTLCLSSLPTELVLCIHRTSGIGSALIKHSKRRRFPSSSWRIDGFFRKVGANPSICLIKIYWKMLIRIRFSHIFSLGKHTQWFNKKILIKIQRVVTKNPSKHIEGKCIMFTSRESHLESLLKPL